MTNKIADLHVHSYYSDGTKSPEEILAMAVQKNVGLLSITDHDMLEGSKELLRINNDLWIKCISGAELNAVNDGINFHILGYGMDLTNENFNCFVKANRALLEEVNSKLIEKMQKDYSDITLDDYNKFQHNKRKGGWKALQYFVEKGITKSLLEGFDLYVKYDLTYTCVEFPTIETVCRQIHNAGGKAVLAHPGKSVKQNTITDFMEEIKKFISMGLDGIECYYPTHSKEITDLCLELCRKNELLITCGSDFHGEFQDTRLGELPISIDKVEMGDILS